MSDDLRKIAEALYRVWDVEIDPQSRPSWDELRPKVRDSWCVLAKEAVAAVGGVPIPMRLTCPECGELHVDEGEFATKPHHTHACQACGMVWRPAVVPTVGVHFLPGFKNYPCRP